MTMGSSLRRAGVAASVLMVLAACGGGSDSDGGGGDAGRAADVDAAKAAVADVIDKPSPFTVTEKLKSLPQGATLAYMNGGTPVGSLLYEFTKPAAQAMGMKLVQYKAGPAANITPAAFDTMIAAKPDAVFIGGIDPARWANKIKPMKDAGIEVVATAISGSDKYDLGPVQSGDADSDDKAKLMANYVVGYMDPKARVALYDIAELPFSRRIGETFEKELESICPQCSVRITHVPASTVGNAAVNTVVSDLQSHPDDTVAVFTSDEIQHGLPEGLDKAGIKIKTLGYAPDPQNLQYLKDGKETAVLATDLVQSVWAIVDQAARQITGQEIVGPQAEGLTVSQFLTPEDVTFDPSRGWTGYPDFAERFAELWGTSK